MGSKGWFDAVSAAGNELVHFMLPASLDRSWSCCRSSASCCSSDTVFDFQSPEEFLQWYGTVCERITIRYKQGGLLKAVLGVAAILAGTVVSPTRWF
jgi:hypothetical protein